MVRRQLASRGISDRRVLAALATVPREHFVPEHLMDQACADAALPAAHGQSISQPFIVALMTQEAALTRRSRVLEIGVRNVTLVVGDGARGYTPAAPYDAIVVAAAAPSPPPALVEQLGPGGRL